MVIVSKYLVTLQFYHMKDSWGFLMLYVDHFIGNLGGTLSYYHHWMELDETCTHSSLDDTVSSGWRPIDIDSKGFRKFFHCPFCCSLDHIIHLKIRDHSNQPKYTWCTPHEILGDEVLFIFSACSNFSVRFCDFFW